MQELEALTQQAIALGNGQNFLTQGETEVARILQICNACRYCEGYCEECEELAHAFQDEQKAIHKFAEKFIQYNEYVTIEFDTEAKTAVVVPVK